MSCRIEASKKYPNAETTGDKTAPLEVRSSMWSTGTRPSFRLAAWASTVAVLLSRFPPGHATMLSSPPKSGNGLGSSMSRPDAQRARSSSRSVMLGKRERML